MKKANVHDYDGELIWKQIYIAYIWYVQFDGALAKVPVDE